MKDYSTLNIVIWSSAVPWMSLTEVPSYSFIINNLDSLSQNANIESILHSETQQNAYKLEKHQHYKQAAEKMLQAVILAKTSLKQHYKIVIYIQAKLMGCKFVEVLLSWVDFYIRRNQKEVTYELLKIINSYTSSSKKYPLKNKRILRLRTLILTATYYIKDTKYFSAQECLHRGFKYLLSANDHRFYHAVILSLIAHCYHETKDYKQALKNSTKAYKILSNFMLKKDTKEYDQHAGILLYNLALHHLGLNQKNEAASVISQACRVLRNLNLQNELESKVIDTMEQIVGVCSNRYRQDLGAMKIHETYREDAKFYQKSFINLDKKQRLISESKKPSRVRIHKHQLFSRFSPYTPTEEKLRTGSSVPSRKIPGNKKKKGKNSFYDEKKYSPISNGIRTPSRNHTVDSAQGINSRFRADFNIKNNAVLMIQRYWRIHNARKTIGRMVNMEYDRFKRSSICIIYQAAQYSSAINMISSLVRLYIPHQLFKSLQLIKKHQNDIKIKIRNHQILMVQACIRGYLIRRSIRIITLAAVKIQAYFKGTLQRKKYQKYLKNAAERSINLDYENNQCIMMSPSEAAIVIQSRYKGYFVRIARKRENCALKIQSMYSGYLVRNHLKNLNNKCIKIQAVIRRKIQRERSRLLKQSVQCIQRIWRGYKARSKLSLMQSSAIQIQSVYRGYRDRKELSLREKSARVIQSWYKSWRALRKSIL